MKKLSFIVMACLMVLGLAQCKKNEPTNNNTADNGNRVSITLTLDNGGQRVHPEEENGLANVVYDNGDVVYVGSNGKYMGYLTYNGSVFAGSINAAATESQPLQFIFMGGQTIDGLTENSSTECVFNIGDQSNGLAVISCAPSNEDFSLTKLDYTAYLRNKCALVKFDLGEVSTDAAITLTGLKTEATINFNGTVTNGAATGNIATYGTGSTRYAVVLSDQAEVTEGTISAEGYEGTFSIPTAAYTNGFLTDATMTLTEAASTIIDLVDVTSNTTVESGVILTGTLGADVKISIADGATVTLDGVSINAEGNWYSDWAGITCLGDATIILKDGTENTVQGFYEDYPGIQPAVGHTLTIKGGAAGTGKLTASSNGYGAGIGGGCQIACGDIEIQGGDITANGGDQAAGIGSGRDANCGTITISGGTVTATGGSSAAGIGSGFYYGASCGAITISGGTVTATGGYGAAGIGSGQNKASCDGIPITIGVTEVTAMKGFNAPNSIGAGNGGSTCGTVTIGGVVIGFITQSPYTYVPQP